MPVFFLNETYNELTNDEFFTKVTQTTQDQLKQAKTLYDGAIQTTWGWIKSLLPWTKAYECRNLFAETLKTVAETLTKIKLQPSTSPNPGSYTTITHETQTASSSNNQPLTTQSLSKKDETPKKLTKQELADKIKQIAETPTTTAPKVVSEGEKLVKEASDLANEIDAILRGNYGDTSRIAGRWAMRIKNNMPPDEGNFYSDYATIISSNPTLQQKISRYQEIGRDAVYKNHVHQGSVQQSHRDAALKDKEEVREARMEKSGANLLKELRNG